MRLPKTQRELLDALVQGKHVYYMQGWFGRPSYFLRMDTQKKVTAIAHALIDKGLARMVVDGPGLVLRATKQGQHA